MRACRGHEAADWVSGRNSDPVSRPTATVEAEHAGGARYVQEQYRVVR